MLVNITDSKAIEGENEPVVKLDAVYKVAIRTTVEHRIVRTAVDIMAKESMSEDKVNSM